MNLSLTKQEFGRLKQALGIAIDSEIASIEVHQSGLESDPWKAMRKRSEQNVKAFRALKLKLAIRRMARTELKGKV